MRRHPTLLLGGAVMVVIVVTGALAPVWWTGDPLAMRPVERLRPLDLDVPGDFSSAAPFLAAATILPGSRLRLHGVGVNPTRTGFLHVLERMGARISVYNRREAGGEPVADLEVSSAELVATEIGPDEVPALIDELPLFALCASHARGDSRQYSAPRWAHALHKKVGRYSGGTWAGSLWRARNWTNVVSAPNAPRSLMRLSYRRWQGC